MSAPPKTETLPQNPTALTAEHLRSVPTVLLSPARTPSVLVMLKDPSSPGAEQYRLLAHAIERQIAEKPGVTIAVSSAVEGEGKTVTSINLAFALAETKVRRVALLDADLRGGRVAETLGMGEVPGLTEVMRGTLQIPGVVRRVEKNLAVFPSGAKTDHPLGFFRSLTWRELISSMRSHFDCIVIDCPPVCVSDDLPVLDDVIDRLLLVVRSGVSRQETIHEALGRISPEKLLGLILNDAPASARKYRTYKQES